MSGLFVCVHCTVHNFHTILHRTDLIIFPLTLQTITIAPMMSICTKWGGEGCPGKAAIKRVSVFQGSTISEAYRQCGAKALLNLIPIVTVH